MATRIAANGQGCENCLCFVCHTQASACVHWNKHCCAAGPHLRQECIKYPFQSNMGFSVFMRTAVNGQYSGNCVCCVCRVLVHQCAQWDEHCLVTERHGGVRSDIRANTRDPPGSESTGGFLIRNKNSQNHAPTCATTVSSAVDRTFSIPLPGFRSLPDYEFSSDPKSVVTNAPTITQECAAKDSEELAGGKARHEQRSVQLKYAQVNRAPRQALMLDRETTPSECFAAGGDEFRMLFRLEEDTVDRSFGECHSAVKHRGRPPESRETDFICTKSKNVSRTQISDPPGTYEIPTMSSSEGNLASSYLSTEHRGNESDDLETRSDDS